MVNLPVPVIAVGVEHTAGVSADLVVLLATVKPQTTAEAMAAGLVILVWNWRVVPVRAAATQASLLVKSWVCKALVGAVAQVPSENHESLAVVRVQDSSLNQAFLSVDMVHTLTRALMVSVVEAVAQVVSAARL